MTNGTSGGTDTTSGGSTTGTGADNSTGTTMGTSGGTETTSGMASTTSGSTTGSTGDTTDTTGGDGGVTGETTGGNGETTGFTGPSKIAGTWENCSSYGEKSGDMCAGYYCSVTAEDIAAELDTTAGPCSHLDPVDICGGSLTGVVAQCARDIKTANPLSSSEDLRPDVQECVYNDPDVDMAEITQECLTCFLDAAVCAGDNCIVQCLGGDSAGCDACRIQNNCNQTVPPCAGFPDPFAPAEQ